MSKLQHKLVELKNDVTFVGRKLGLFLRKKKVRNLSLKSERPRPTIIVLGFSLCGYQVIIVLGFSLCGYQVFVGW